MNRPLASDSIISEGCTHSTSVSPFALIVFKQKEKGEERKRERGRRKGSDGGLLDEENEYLQTSHFFFALFHGISLVWQRTVLGPFLACTSMTMRWVVLLLQETFRKLEGLETEGCQIFTTENIPGRAHGGWGCPAIIVKNRISEECVLLVLYTRTYLVKRTCPHRAR